MGLTDVLSYDKETGHFTWLVSTRNTKPGQRAGNDGPNGYRVVTFNKKRYYEHRLAWYFTHEEWPFEVDHINRDKADNRLCNLREVTKSQNQWNRGLQKNNTPGVSGVSWCNFTDRWTVTIKVGGAKHRLGRHDTLFDAAAVAQSFRNRMHRVDEVVGMV